MRISALSVMMAPATPRTRAGARSNHSRILLKIARSLALTPFQRRRGRLSTVETFAAAVRRLFEAPEGPAIDQSLYFGDRPFRAILHERQLPDFLRPHP